MRNSDHEVMRGVVWYARWRRVRRVSGVALVVLGIVAWTWLLLELWRVS